MQYRAYILDSKEGVMVNDHSIKYPFLLNNFEIYPKLNITRISTQVFCDAVHQYYIYNETHILGVENQITASDAIDPYLNRIYYHEQEQQGLMIQNLIYNGLIISIQIPNLSNFWFLILYVRIQKLNSY